MPLFKRKVLPFIEPPEDLKPNEVVFQVRFTKEIFRDYKEYLKRINLYRQRVWTCKVTGKINLTYEEALLSENKASEQVQNFPKEFMGPILLMIQFSVLGVNDLVDKIFKRFKEHYVAGETVIGIFGDSVRQCEILKVVELDSSHDHCNCCQYEVSWQKEDGEENEKTIVSPDKLRRRKHPLTRALLKSFIRESTFGGSTRNSPWIVHDKLARKYNVPFEPPEDLKHVVLVLRENNREAKVGGSKDKKSKDEKSQVKKRKRDSDGGSQTIAVEPIVNKSENGNTISQKQAKKKPKTGKENTKEGESLKKGNTKDGKKTLVAVEPVPIKYPIDDRLVEPCLDDNLMERPVPSTDFILPMECIGDFLMAWDFCISFGRVINLSPFRFEDLEKALIVTDRDVILLKEIHLALLKTAMMNPELPNDSLSSRKKLSIRTCEEDLADFLEIEDVADFLGMKDLSSLKSYASTIRRGRYKELTPLAKLHIMNYLVECSLGSSKIREQLDENIEELHAIAARKREEKLEENRKKKEEQERSKHDTESLDKTVGDHLNDSALEDKQNSARQTKSKAKANGEHVYPDKSSKNRSLAKETSSNNLEALKGQEKEPNDQETIKQQKEMEKQKREEHFEREKMKCFIRSNPLGKDRNYNQYWFYPKEGRIFIESDDSRTWSYYGSKEELDQFIGSLNLKGVRERALKHQLEKRYAKISNALQKRWKEISQKVLLEEASVRRSNRVKTIVQPTTGCLTYTNKYRN